jgi:predicted nucleic acid-binding Zn ribbon protein
MTAGEEPVAGSGDDAAADSGIDLARSLLAGARSGRTPGSAAARGSGKRRRGVPDAGIRSAAAADERDPQLLGDSVDRLVVDRGWELSVAVGGVLGRWSQVVGPDIAAHSEPEAFDDGVVTVRAQSTAWATQLRMLAPTLVRRLNDELGAATVTRVEVVGPSGPSWRKGKLRVPGRGPRDTYG